MNCPNDGTTLMMSERQGVEIDYCPQCRGVWLDRGELDKILDRAKAESEPTASASQAAPRAAEGRRDDHSSGDRSYDDRQYGDRHDQRYNNSKYRKKKSPSEFLGDLFEG